MFNTSFYEIIKNHNQTINKINCALRKMEKDINCYIEKDPSVVLYSYDPIDTENNHYFEFDYPNIIFSLSPFKITISYKEIADRLNGQINNNSLVEQTIEMIILEHIGLQ